MTGWGRFWLDLWACFLIPAYTLLFAGAVAWFGTNFSVLAVTGPEHYRGFVVWGVLAGIYFLAVMWWIGGRMPRRRSRWGVRGLTILGCFSLGGALMLPYLPQSWPKVASAHIILAFVACVLVMLALLLALRTLIQAGKRACRPLMRGWLAVTAGSAALFLVGGMVTSALEVFFTISAVQLARRLLLRVADMEGGKTP